MTLQVFIHSFFAALLFPVTANDELVTVNFQFVGLLRFTHNVANIAHARLQWLQWSAAEPRHGKTAVYITFGILNSVGYVVVNDENRSEPKTNAKK